jgi:hypothetical protein
VNAAVDILSLAVVATGVAALARRLRWSEPLALIVVGIGISFILKASRSG